MTTTAMQQFKSFVSIVVALSCCACDLESSSTKLQAELHRGLSGEPSTLDPAAAGDTFSQEVIRDLYEGLTTESATGEIEPGVALSWDVDSAGMRYTFHLRKDARWSNGEPVRSQDFVFGWRRVVDPKTASPVADILKIISHASEILAGKQPPTELGVSALNDRTLVVMLERPAPYLPQLLTHTAASPAYSRSNSITHDSVGWVSNGPYVLSDWSNGSSIHLLENQAYWDKKNVAITKIDYEFISDENAQLARYRSGQLDLTDTVPANALPWIRSESPKELVISPFLATAYYGFNLSERLLATNIKLRHALALSIDRKRLVETLGFGQQSAYGFVPPGTWNYSPQSWPWSKSSDLERIAEARQLYKEAGYAPASPLRLRLLLNSNPLIRKTAIVIASMWKEVLGLEIELIDEEYRVFLDSRRDKSRWDIVRLGWTADYNDAGDFLEIFRQSSSNNDPGYSNSAYDELINKADNTQSAESRRQLLEAGERALLADYPVIPLYFYVSKRLAKPYLIGLRANPLNRVPSKVLRFSPH